MRKRFLLFGFGCLGIHVFSNKFHSVILWTKLEIYESFFFSPFSWFFALLFFILGFISLSKLIFMSLLIRLSKMELFMYGLIFLSLLFLYRLPALILMIFAILYASLEIREHTKRIQRYKRRRKN